MESECSITVTVDAPVPGHQQAQCWEGIKYIDGLMQKRRNSSALAMELRLSSTN